MERMSYLGINGRGWYTRVYSRGVRRLVSIKIFYLDGE